MRVAVLCQLLLFAYHQTTTLVDLYPFNGVRNSSQRERFIEAGINALLMCLAPIGFIFGIRSLMLYGVVYYFVLLLFELIIWWVPYFTRPEGRWRAPYNLALALATTAFAQKDPLADWSARHIRVHEGTVTPLRRGKGPILPNLEHIILHFWTAITALVTLEAYRALATR
jgi:hypothetical protein